MNASGVCERRGCSDAREGWGTHLFAPGVLGCPVAVPRHVNEGLHIQAGGVAFGVHEISNVLVMDPVMRCVIDDALAHPWSSARGSHPG